MFRFWTVALEFKCLLTWVRFYGSINGYFTRSIEKLTTSIAIGRPKRHHDHHTPKIFHFMQIPSHFIHDKTLLIQLSNFRRQHGEESHQIVMTFRQSRFRTVTEAHSSLIGKVNKTSKLLIRSGKLGTKIFRATQASITCSIHVTTLRVAKTNPAIDYPWKRLSSTISKTLFIDFQPFVFICHLLRLRNFDSSISTYSRSGQTPFLETFFPRCVPTSLSRDSSFGTQNWWSNLMSGLQRDPILINESLRNGFDVSHTIDAIRRPFFIGLRFSPCAGSLFVNIFRALHNFQLKSFRQVCGASQRCSNPGVVVRNRKFFNSFRASK